MNINDSDILYRKYALEFSQIWNFGANASLLDNRLSINIEATDILNRNHLYDITTVTEGTVCDNWFTPDTRGLTIRVSYTLFNKNILTNVKRGNISDIERIEK